MQQPCARLILKSTQGEVKLERILRALAKDVSFLGKYSICSRRRLEGEPADS